MVSGANTPLTVDLTGYNVAISAGANGIGKVMAHSFAFCGARVFVSDVDTHALEMCGHPGMKADAGDPAQCEAFVDAAVKHLGGLDVLINNAGIAGPTKLVEHCTPEEVEATLRIDVASMFAMSRRAIPVLRKNGGGAIINLSSAAGRFGFPLRAPYAAAKWGVIGFTKSLRLTLLLCKSFDHANARYGVRQYIGDFSPDSINFFKTSSQPIAYLMNHPGNDGQWQQRNKR